MKQFMWLPKLCQHGSIFERNDRPVEDFKFAGALLIMVDRLHKATYCKF
jgi:hypothetical protein